MSTEFRFCQKCSNVVGDGIHGHKEKCPDHYPTYLTKEIQEANKDVYPEYDNFEVELINGRTL